MEDTRRELARHFLKQSKIELNETAFLLGFEDANSFFRAFQNWEGTSPKEWRSRNCAWGVKPRHQVASEKVQAARERLVAAIEAAQACCQTVQEKTVAGAKATDKVIRDHPYPSIGVAFGVGLLVGWIITRK